MMGKYANKGFVMCSDQVVLMKKGNEFTLM